MTWEMNEREFESVSALPAQRRYDYFVKRVADWEEVWSLGAGEADWVLAGDDEGNEAVPVWPHERFAAACAEGEWSESEAQSIPLQEFVEDWLPGMASDGRSVAVFMRPDGDTAYAKPERLLEDIRSELSLIED